MGSSDSGWPASCGVAYLAKLHDRWFNFGAKPRTHANTGVPTRRDTKPHVRHRIVSSSSRTPRISKR